MAVGAAAVTDVARRSDGGRRQRRNSAQGSELAARLHDVSQWGGVRGGCAQCGQRPISTMRPAQTGHRSMR